ncbi:hypothetical protein [Microvirga tunisiensis]|uniref:DUF4893 domain-containing protein n=1 Tax=Microvirga tunisiensis TaxID=2108360 RepID=A0A5N7MB06_9HYPH|nr:hypothetical protein [Microvirga tunisiensis]MPR05668.1 hypothetical protein [Microvirga tunisiensis]MPR23868.1 hypothetical protein [Microvirga tunisiensis]
MKNTIKSLAAAAFLTLAPLSASGQAGLDPKTINLDQYTRAYFSTRIDPVRRPDLMKEYGVTKQDLTASSEIRIAKALTSRGMMTITVFVSPATCSTNSCQGTVLVDGVREPVYQGDFFYDLFENNPDPTGRRLPEPQETYLLVAKDGRSIRGMERSYQLR